MDAPENNLESRFNKLGDEFVVEKGKKSGHPYFSPGHLGRRGCRVLNLDNWLWGADGMKFRYGSFRFRWLWVIQGQCLVNYRIHRERKARIWEWSV